MNVRSLRASARAGFTLLEVTIAGMLLAVIAYGVATSTLSARRAYQAGMIQDSITMRAQRALDRIADAIAMSGAATFTPNPAPPVGSSTLTFRTPAGWNVGAVVWGATSRAEFRYSATDPNDGFDNDGDGFVDDGEAWLVLDVGTVNERDVRLVRGVAEFAPGETFNGADDDGNGLRDDRGLFFSLVGDQLTISLALVERDSDGRNVVRTVSTSVTVRN